MAGQIKPTHLFHLRLDKDMLALLRGLPRKNAHTVFGAICDKLTDMGVTLKPACLFMESAMPTAGCLTTRPPDDRELADMRLGLKVAKTTSGLEIGQTVLIKDGTILAVEAFEGTDETIRRAGRLSGPGAVLVKVAKQGHDMRFDIPVIGMKTLKSVRKAGISAIALEALRTILLERDKVLKEADRLDLAIMAIDLDETDQLAATAPRPP